MEDDNLERQDDYGMMCRRSWAHLGLLDSSWTASPEQPPSTLGGRAALFSTVRTMKRARAASERDHRLMNDLQWDNFWHLLDAKRAEASPPRGILSTSRETIPLSTLGKDMEEPPPSAKGGRNQRSHRCGTCTACRASDCGRCKNCRDKPRCGRQPLPESSCWSVLWGGWGAWGLTPGTPHAT